MTLNSALGCDTMEELSKWYDEEMEVINIEVRAILDLIDKAKRCYSNKFDKDRLDILNRLSVDLMNDDIKYIDQCFDDRKEDI